MTRYLQEYVPTKGRSGLNRPDRLVAKGCRGRLLFWWLIKVEKLFWMCLQSMATCASMIHARTPMA
jgi:hypothetical protein